VLSLLAIGCGAPPQVSSSNPASEPRPSRVSAAPQNAASKPTSSRPNSDAPPSTREMPFAVALVPQLGHGNGIAGISISPNGTVAATASADKTVRVWDTESGILLRVLPIGDQAYDVAILRDNRHAAVTAGRTLELWDLAQGKRIFQVKVDQARLARLHHSDHVILGDGGGGVALWDMAQGRLIKQVRPGRQGDRLGIRAVDLSMDDRLVACAREDGVIQLIDVATGEIRQQLTGHRGLISAVQFSRNANTLTSFGHDTTIRQWDVNTGATLHTIQFGQWIAAASLLTDEIAVVSGGGDDVAKKIRLSDGTPLQRLEPWPNVQLYGTEQIALSGDGKRAVIGTMNGAVQFSNLSDGSPIHATPQRRLGAFSIAVSAQGDRLAVGFGGGEVDVWDRLMGSRVQHLRYIRSTIGMGPVVYSPDGRFLLRQAEMAIFVSDARSGEQIRKIEAPRPSTIYELAISRDGRLLAASGAQSLAVFELETGQHLWSASDQTFIDCVAFSPDGMRVIASSSNRKTRVYDANTGTLTGSIKGPASPASIDFLDANTVLLGGSDVLGLWDLRSGEQVRRYATLSTGAGTAAFSADRKWVVAGTDEGVMAVFNANTGAKVTQFVAHDDHIRRIIPSPDGKLLYSTSFDGTVRVTPMDSLLSGNAATDPRSLVWVSDNTDWLSYAADGYFDASRRGGGLVAAVNGLEGYRVDQLAVRNNRPDLALGRLGLGSADANATFASRYHQRLRRLGIEENSLSRNLLTAPKAAIVEVSRSGRTAHLKCSLDGNGHQLKRYYVFVNDVAVGDGEGAPLSGGKAMFDVDVELSSGRNKIEVSALNEIGVESLRDVRTVNVSEKVPGNLYYLGFGVSSYRDTRLNLKYASKDALDLGAALKKAGGRTYDDVRTNILTDGEVTKANMEAARKFLTGAGLDDTVVVFVAGHGVFQTGPHEQYYFIPHEADIARIHETGVSFDVIEDLVTGIAPRKKLLLLDTCESGEREGDDEVIRVGAGRSRGLVARGIRPSVINEPKSDSSHTRLLGNQDRYIFNDLSRRSGSIVFSASHGSELSYEDDRLKNGVFTYELVQALTGRGADTDHNGVVNTDELRTFVSQTVSERTQGLQNPTVDRDNLEAFFGFSIGDDAKPSQVPSANSEAAPLGASARSKRPSDSTRIPSQRDKPLGSRPNLPSSR